MLSKEQIYDIYEKHVAINYTKEYWNRYVSMPFELNGMVWKWENKDFPRVIALLEFENYLPHINVRNINKILLRRNVCHLGYLVSNLFATYG